jgi:arylsulfatase A-like enzyme
VASGRASDTLIGGVDVMPTLLNLCGLPTPKSCTGVDKSAAAMGLPMPAVDSIYCEYQVAWRMVRSDRYKLVTKDNTAPMTIDRVTDLYDMDADPYELSNLVGEESHAAIKQQLYDRMVQWIADTGDTWPATPPKALGMYTN